MLGAVGLSSESEPELEESCLRSDGRKESVLFNSWRLLRLTAAMLVKRHGEDEMKVDPICAMLQPRLRGRRVR